MKLLIIGAKGQLGWELRTRGGQQELETVCVDLPEFDITDRAQVAAQVESVMPDLVINASAYTAVDKAESQAELAFAVNEAGPKNLATPCAALNIPLVHVSTDYVFSGDKKTPYYETDPVAPIGVYGRSKAAGEAAIRDRLAPHIIIRTAWLYGVSGPNFVKTMLRLGQEREVVRVVADQYGCPTYAADLADAILVIAKQIGDGAQEKWGTYHYCGRGDTSWYGFASAIFEIARPLLPLKVQTVEPVSSDVYPTAAKRPINSVLDCSRIEKTFNIQTHPWKERLAKMLKIVLSDPTAV